MVRNKITIEDLTDNQEIKLTNCDTLINNNLKEKAHKEIETFISLKKNREIQVQQGSPIYTVIPKTTLEKKLDAILNKRTVEEIKENKNFQHQYSTKMQRIKRIKSKTYRRFKREAKKVEKEQIQQDQAMDSNNCEAVPVIEQFNEDVEEVENAPIFEFKGKASDTQTNEIVKLAFKDTKEENVKEFIGEKENLINEEAPFVSETILPGWGGWAGPGLKVKKTKYNVVVDTKKGIKNKDRKDFASSHVIINETKEVLDDKFKCKVPFGYTREEYIDKLNRPISKECNTNRIFNKLIKEKMKVKKGKCIKPEKFTLENNNV